MKNPSLHSTMASASGGRGAASDETAPDLSRDGAVVMRGLVDFTWVETLRRAVAEALAAPTPLGHQLVTAEGTFTSDMYLSQSFPEFWRFAAKGPVAAALGERAALSVVRLFTDELLVKAPQTSQETPWHHDAPYWPLRGAQIYSAWIPLDPVTRSSGALRFVRGSHRWDRRFHPVDFDTGARRITSADEEALPDLSALSEARDVLTAEVEPGDVVLFHGLTLHAASGNPRPDIPRRAVVLRLVGPDVVWDPRPRTLPLPWAPRLAPGEPLGGELFPVLWERS